MRYSVRGLLALTLLIAVMLLGWMNYQRGRQLQAQVEQLANMIQLQEALLHMDDPDLHHALVSLVVYI